MALVDFVKAISPPWLVGRVTPNVPLPQAAGVSERFLYALAEGLDYVAEKITQAIAMRFPGLGDASALPELARDRRITQGFAETNAAYERRLVRWLDTWRRAGTPASVIESVSYYVGVQPKITSVLQCVTYGMDSARYDVLAESTPASGYPTTVYEPLNWFWDRHFGASYVATDSEKWLRRRWLVIAYKNTTTTQTWVTATRTFGDGIATLGASGYCVGMVGNPIVFSDLCALAKTWKSAGARYWWIIVNFSTNPLKYDPAEAPGSANLPDVTWQNWSKIDTSGVRPVRVPSRFSDSRFIACEVTE